MVHSFDREIATEYGMLEAVLLNYFYFWIEKNKANNINFYDGKYWTFNSIKAMKSLFPYATKGSLERCLNHLKKEGLIITGNYNKEGYDRTLWYALTEKAEDLLISKKSQSDAISQKQEMDSPKTGNGFPENEQPIPFNNTFNNTIYINIVEYLNQKANTHYKANTKKTQSLINARLSEGFTEEDFRKVIDKKVTEWKGTEWEQYLKPDTLFTTKFEGYLNQKIIKNKPKEDMINHNYGEDFWEKRRWK